MENTHSNKHIKLSSPGTSTDNLSLEPDAGSSEQADSYEGPLDKCKCMSALASPNGCKDEFWTEHSSFSSGKMIFGNFSAEAKV